MKERAQTSLERRNWSIRSVLPKRCCYRPRSEGDNVIGSIRPSVRLCEAKGGHYQSEGYVCLSVISRACADNRVDAVDRLLIFI